MTTIDEMIAVLQAAKSGKQIEYIWKKANNGKWLPTSAADLNFSEYYYRVKPEPREWLMSERILDNAQYDVPGGKLVKVREVLE